MGILNFDKPKKVRSTGAHNDMYMSDAGVDGTYVPNMTQQDNEDWKAKHIRGEDERIEIRKSIGYVQMVIIVYRKVRSTPGSWHAKINDHENVRISMNGKVNMSFNEYDQMTQAIIEAKEILRVRDINVGDVVELPLGEEGFVEEIVTDRLDWFPYKVRITKADIFNAVGDLVEFKTDQILKK